MRAATVFLLSFLVGSFGLDVCPDDMYNETGVGGPGATAVLNVSDAGACCALCHGDYHDECAAWIFGQSGVAELEYPAHNCAIMPHLQKKRHVAGHISGIVRNPPGPAPSPSPSPGSKPCRADLDCDIRGSALWRCSRDPKGKHTPESNCHIPGPGTQGNNTCSCQSPKCKAGPTAPKNASATQYLMIGDSISMGMKANVQATLTAQGYELTHNPGNAASANWGWHCLADWLQTRPPAKRTWNVISFQFGLHDLGFDTERISVEQYSALLSNVTNALVDEQKKHGTKLIWVTTTPVPTVPTYGPGCNDTQKCLNPPRFDKDAVLYNSAAAEVMETVSNQRGAKIDTLDLYSFVLKQCGGSGYATCDGFQLPKNVHFTAKGWAALGQQMAKAVLHASAAEHKQLLV